jgi:hypothetical protein
VLERLTAPTALLDRADLRLLGWGERDIDRIFRACATIALPGAKKARIFVGDYLELVQTHTYRNDRVRPTQ